MVPDSPPERERGSPEDRCLLLATPPQWRTDSRTAPEPFPAPPLDALRSPLLSPAIHHWIDRRKVRAVTPEPPPVPHLDPPDLHLTDQADTEHAGQRIDEGKGRVFPCDGCGSDLKFHIGEQNLACPYCGHVKTIDLTDDATIEEQDFRATLERATELSRARNHKRAESSERRTHEVSHEVTCADCGATVEFIGSLVSVECAFCGQPVQVDHARQAEEALPVDGILPFGVKREKAAELLRRWVKSRWFAPNAFKKAGVQGKFSGVYLPFWTYDSMTFNRYTGQRGEYYYVTVGSGKNQRQERRTRWYPASGRFQRFFDDVLVVATRSLPDKLLRKLEPWPLSTCRAYDQSFLAGFLARRYEVDLDEGFGRARLLMDSALRQEVCRRIGGDTQRITSLDTRHDAITFKHLLLPVWSLGYRFKGKPYQLVINAVTGEVQGTRPWSFWKIFFAALLGLIVVGGIVAVSQS